MTLRVVGAGLGRTGTVSLKVALERLLDAPCYHMTEVFRRPGHVAVWRAAADGVEPDWRSFFDGYAAVLDWPAAGFWRELAEAHPQALVLLSHRDPEAWWRSARDTIFPAIAGAADPWGDMMGALLDVRFSPQWDRREAALAAYQGHLAEVRRLVPRQRLVEWRPEDGWEPLCRALGVGVPDMAFPHANTTRDFLARRN